jgi:hypothetical protein
MSLRRKSPANVNAAMPGFRRMSCSLSQPNEMALRRRLPSWSVRDAVASKPASDREPHQSRPAALRLAIAAPATRPRATVNATRIVAIHPRPESLPRLGPAATCVARATRPKDSAAPAPRRTRPIKARQPIHHRPRRHGHARISETERIDGDGQAGGQRRWIGSPSSTVETLANVAVSRANQPVVSELGAWGSMPVRSSRPCVGRMP